MDSYFDDIKWNINRGYYKYIGSGSCREVFDLRNGCVMKIAKNRAGIAQNKSEYKISAKDHSYLFAKVIQAPNDFTLLIMKKADKIYDISCVLEYFDVTSKEELLSLKELKNISKKYKLILGDLARESSWGIIDGRLVIIDYGFTKKVQERYY
jgi:hypothetical protein